MNWKRSPIMIKMAFVKLCVVEIQRKMAERGGHAPHTVLSGAISLARNPGALARFAFLRCSRQGLHLH